MSVNCERFDYTEYNQQSTLTTKSDRAADLVSEAVLKSIVRRSASLVCRYGWLFKEKLQERREENDDSPGNESSLS